jgi:hypothetical protein
MKTRYMFAAAALLFGMNVTAHAASYTTPMVCDTDFNTAVDGTGTAKINNAGKLSATINGVAPHLIVDCRVTCGSAGSGGGSVFVVEDCGESDANGKLKVAPVAIVDDLPGPCADVKVEICAAGFNEGGCIEGIGDGEGVFGSSYCRK